MPCESKSRCSLVDSHASACGCTGYSQIVFDSIPAYGDGFRERSPGNACEDLGVMDHDVRLGCLCQCRQAGENDDEKSHVSSARYAN